MKILVITCLTLLSLSVYAETIKIGYIDTEKVVNNLPQYIQSTEKISNEFEPKKQELLDLFKHIELLRIKINTINNSENKENLEIELSKLASLEESPIIVAPIILAISFRVNFIMKFFVFFRLLCW